MNAVILSGRLTADPEIRYTTGENSTRIARYTLAVDRNKAGEADFIRCIAFEKAAGFAETYLKKGMKIIVQGRIITGSYQNKDGQKVYTFDVSVAQQEFCESKKAEPDIKNAEFMNVNGDADGLPFD